MASTFEQIITIANAIRNVGGGQTGADVDDIIADIREGKPVTEAQLERVLNTPLSLFFPPAGASTEQLERLSASLGVDVDNNVTIGDLIV